MERQTPEIWRIGIVKNFHKCASTNEIQNQYKIDEQTRGMSVAYMKVSVMCFDASGRRLRLLLTYRFILNIVARNQFFINFPSKRQK